MTSQSPRIYTYKITFEEVPYYYYGVHKEKKFDEEYYGTPKTHKWCWEFYTPEKQILEIFNYTDAGWEEAQLVEKRLIKPVLNEKFCLNESCGGFLSIEQKRKGVQRQKELCIGLYGITLDKRKETGKKSGNKTYELGIGIHSLTAEDRKRYVKITNSQKWLCLETGYITTSGGLTHYQKARGIDTTKRKKIS